MSAIAARNAGLLAKLLAILSVTSFFACESTTPVRDIRATILDERGRPIPGALLYAEAVTDEGPFSFISASSGQAGEVPKNAIRALKIPWKRGARLALAAFAEGRSPTVLHDPARSVASDGVSLTLAPVAQPADAWNPDLLLLEFPFETSPEVAQTIREPRYADLREAFRAAYAARPAEKAPTTREAAKISAIQSLP